MNSFGTEFRSFPKARIFPEKKLILGCGACSVTPNFGNFAKCRRIFVVATVSARYLIYIWQLDRSNGGVTSTVTSDDLDLLY